MQKNIAILMGGYSSEFDISIQSGNVVYKHIDRNIYNPYRIHITTAGWFYVDDTETKQRIDTRDFSIIVNNTKITFDAVFNTVHGTPGEDGLLQAYLQLTGIPQTACDYYQAALTFNKRDCISVLKPYEIPVAQNFFINKGDPIDAKKIIDAVSLPCFVKANKSGSSYGVSKVKKIEELQAAIDIAFKEDDEIIVESFLSGIEVSIGVIMYEGHPKVMPATEIVTENEFFDYEAKYLGKSEEITPARLSTEDTQKLQTLALKVYTTLKMKGLSRIDFIFHNGIPHFVEINTNPGLSEASLLPQQAAFVGISLTALFTNTIEACFE